MPYPNDQGNPAGAIPVYVTSGGGGISVTDESQSLPGGVEVVVLPANPSRKYLFIQCVTDGVDIWVNMFGGSAEVNGLGSFLLSAGQTYESGTYVSATAVSIYSGAAADVTIAEG